MILTKRTKTKAITPLMNEERVRQLAEQCPNVPLRKPLLKMSVGEFIEALQEDYALSLLRSRRALKAFGRLHTYLDEMKAVTAWLKRYESATDAKEKQAAEGIDFPSLAERILLDCVRVYHLHSTAEAERLPITDWLLAVKSEGTSAQFQRRCSELINKK